ncbi:MAG: hypothetical protein RLZZ237_2520 [Pseudomonadota bacterium]|jgi:hypothetical protein
MQVDFLNSKILSLPDIVAKKITGHCYQISAFFLLYIICSSNFVYFHTEITIDQAILRVGAG